MYFHRLKQSAVDVLERAGYLPDIGRENLFSIGQNVIDAIYPKLDVEVCRRCPTRIFRQCQRSLPNGEPRSPDVVTVDHGRRAP
jgi:SulP family sulfate permease